MMELTAAIGVLVVVMAGLAVGYFTRRASTAAKWTKGAYIISLQMAEVLPLDFVSLRCPVEIIA